MRNPSIFFDTDKIEHRIIEHSWICWIILNQMEFHLIQNRKENCHHNHIQFNVKGIGSIAFSVYSIATTEWLKCAFNSLLIPLYFFLQELFHLLHVQKWIHFIMTSNLYRSGLIYIIIKFCVRFFIIVIVFVIDSNKALYLYVDYTKLTYIGLYCHNFNTLN